MGTNPKRTVTVQMVPQLAVLDTLGNNEPNANWSKEPNLKVAPVCPKAMPTSPDHKTDNKSLSSSPANTNPETQTTVFLGAEPLSSTVCEKPEPKSGNCVTTGDQQMPELSPTGQGSGRAGDTQRDSNANMKTLKEEHFKADVSSAVSATKGDVQSKDRRIKDQSATEECAQLTSSGAEDSKERASPNNRNLNSACELRQTASKPQLDSKGSSSACKNKDSSPLRDHRQSSAHLQDITAATAAAPVTANAPPSDSKKEEGGLMQKNPNSTHREKDLPALKQSQVSSDERQPVSLQADSSTLPQAPRSMAAHGQAVEGATAACEGQQRRDLHREASTMTLSPSSTPVKQCRDMAVQAVANTCSKAVSTSPSLLPHAVTRRTSGGAVLVEEMQSLAIVCQVDKGVGLHQVDVGTLSASSDPRSERITVEAEMCPNINVAFHSENLSQQQDKGLGAKPKDAGSALCNTRPVYQINIEHGNHKEHGETGDSQNKSGLQVSSLKTAAAEAPCLKPGASPKTSAEPQSAVRSDAEMSPAAVTTKNKRALPAATAKKSDLTKNKAESSVKKSRGKVLTKETKSGKAKIEPERKDEEDDQLGTEKGKNVHDVLWDEQGMTWEVYGASVDPESLGFAIQSHLQCKIKEQERKLFARTSIRKSVSGVDSPQRGRKNKRRQQNIFRSMLQNARRPSCCVRPPPSSVLE
ncbi:G protein-regulated inducer of neurite outgrowth 3-like [Brachionichthys hirsutus]|uniref:G protein-regulated inducer of neurite outgrowth 3-like n=1 Tax=Brachionichthys hirsutus TaxID=412623 RepID=UPI00360499D8